MMDALPGPPLEWGAFFGNHQPVELEVGCGRGLFLFTASTACPERNFIGLDCDLKEARRAALRLQKRLVPNARIVGGDAQILLPRYVPDGSVSAVHVYFPDPWWKKRHRKRRIFNPGFVSQCVRILNVGGELHSWTDVEEYFDEYRPLVSAHPALEEVPAPAERAPEHDMDYHTSFERKKRKEGLPIYRARWVRREGSHLWPAGPYPFGIAAEVPPAAGR
jgi:tRNA (guanine-N7-)-methyltransferase